MAKKTPVKKSASRTGSTASRNPAARSQAGGAKGPAGKGADKGKGKGKAGAPPKQGRIKQIRQSYTLTKQADPNIGWILLAVFVLTGLVVGGLAFAFYRSWIFPPLLGVMTGLLVTLIVFGKRAQKSALAQIEGKPGAAAAALGVLRRGWKIEPAIAVTKQQDLITRVVGPPGIVLIGEGNPNRVRPLLTNERRKHERVAREIPIHDLVVGNDPGQVSLRKLPRHVTKLGRDLKPAAMTDLLARLKALDAHRSAVPMPKGPVPTSMKGMRQNMRGR